MIEADRREGFRGGGKCIGAAAEFERDRDIFERGHRGQQVKGLEDDADPSAAEPGERILIEAAEIDSVDSHLSGARPLQPAEHHHQCGFPGAGGADDADRLAGIDLERDAAENVDGTGSAPQCQVDIVQHHERAAGMKRGGHTPSEPGKARRSAKFDPRRRAPKPPTIWRDDPCFSTRCEATTLYPPLRKVPHWRRLVFDVSLLADGAHRSWRAAPVIVDFGDSLTAGYGVAGRASLPGAAGGVAPRAGHRGAGGQCRGIRRYHGGRPGPARLGARRQARPGYPCARRQRRVARHRSFDGARQSRQDDPENRGHRRESAASRNARAAKLGRGVQATRSTRSFPSLHISTICRSIRFFSRAWR